MVRGYSVHSKLWRSLPATTVAGAQLVYTLSVTNHGPADAQSVTVTDTLPPGTVFVSASNDTMSDGSFSSLATSAL